MAATGRSAIALGLAGLVAAAACNAPPDAPKPERGTSSSRVTAAAPSARFDELRRAFPAHAGEVLTRARAVAHALTLALPARGDEPVVVTTASGRSIRIREIGASGPATREGDVVAYARAQGASFWKAHAGGGRAVEEWLVVPEGDAGVVATWSVAGARLRADLRGVDLLDERGRALVRVTAPVAWDASGARVAVLLEAHGAELSLRLAAHAGAALVDPLWSPVASMAEARMRHTATLLDDGTVLVAGGQGSGGPLASAERYDPATDTWTPAGALATPRAWHAAARLTDGRVLVAGGLDGATPLASAELYDPGANAWSAAAPMSTARYRASATLLPSGKVLVVGGFQGASTLASAELYDPQADAWTAAAAPSARGAHRAARLASGDVLVAGGLFLGPGLTVTLADTALYDEASDTWTPGPSLATARYDETLTVLADGGVFVAGGSSSDGFVTSTLASTERAAAALAAFAPGPALSTPRAEHTATLLDDGRVLVAGGDAAGTADLFDPASNALAPTAPLSTPRLFHTATLLASGDVLVAGGEDAAPLASAEVFTPPAGLGGACASDVECASGHCAGGVCCDTACDGACEACAIAGGAPADGTCAPLSGTPCDDGDACTTGDACQQGTCAGAAVTCAAADACHGAGVCDPGTGQCTTPALADDTPCDDGNPCTTASACAAGVCTGTMFVTCPGVAPDACHDAPACDPETGKCAPPPLLDGTPCDGDDPCAAESVCVGGACVTKEPVQCGAANECQSKGTCDPATGLCSKPNKPDGTFCSGGRCVGGACVSPEGPPPDPSDAGVDAGTSDDAGASGGCGCRTAPRDEREHGAALGLFVLLAIVLRRRAKQG